LNWAAAHACPLPRPRFVPLTRTGRGTHKPVRGSTVTDLWDDVKVSSPGDDNDDDDFTGEEIPEYEALFNAPDFDFLKDRKRTQAARNYERRVQSMLKAGVIGSLQRGNLPDAAALIKTGPKFARALGDSAADNENIARVLDMLTAPDSPIVPLVVTGLSLASQLLRNHREEAETVAQNMKMNFRERRAHRKAIAAGQVEGAPQATTTVKLPFGRKITLGFRIQIPGKRIWQTLTGGAVHPDVLAHTVFSDTALLKELEKHNIIIQVKTDG
jgi:hypothetical protein